MQLAANLAALPFEGADLLRLEPDVLDEPRDTVLIHAKLRDIPTMNDVVGGNEQADSLADRYNHRIIDLQQIVFLLGCGRRRTRLADLLPRRGKIRVVPEVVCAVI